MSTESPTTRCGVFLNGKVQCALLAGHFVANGSVHEFVREEVRSESPTEDYAFDTCTGKIVPVTGRENFTETHRDVTSPYWNSSRVSAYYLAGKSFALCSART